MLAALLIGLLALLGVGLTAPAYAAAAVVVALLLPPLAALGWWSARPRALALREALDALALGGIGVASWHLDHQRVQASPPWVSLLGAPGRRVADPLQWLSAAHPLDQDQLRAALTELLSAHSETDDCRVPLRLFKTQGAQGEWRWHELRARVLARHDGGHGRATRLLTTLTDIDAQRAAAERERISLSLFQHLSEGVVITNTDYRVLDANPAFCRILGAPREALVGEVLAALRPDNPALLAETRWQARVATARLDGAPCSLHLTAAVITEPHGPARYRVITVTDMTATEQQRQQLRRQVSFDALTGLPNHEAFMRLLRQSLAAAEREGFRLAVCRLDLDQFKQINQTQGGAAADALLRQVAQRLQAALRAEPTWSDVVARIGGDEFALLLRLDHAAGALEEKEAQGAMQRLLQVLRMPYPTDPGVDAGAALAITASIGATVFPLDHQDAETLMRHAAHALYRVKHTGRDGVQFFDAAQRQRDADSLLALARVRQALDDGELRLFYQPTVHLGSGRVLGVEALLRWLHPQRGLLAPVQFLPMIESTSLGLQVGDWVIEQALKQSAQWLSQGLALTVSVNVTARQLQMPDFALRLQELVLRHAEPVARHLSLEVLESAALADIAATHALIQRCRDFGVGFALDDFGTGYSTLTYLKNLPVDGLKIDRSFVQNMLTDAQDMALIEGVLGLAKNFGCKVIAEGVESSAQAHALLRLGCNQGQGNGIAAAMPATALADWIRLWTASFAGSPWQAPAGLREPALP